VPEVSMNAEIYDVGLGDYRYAEMDVSLS
jgi:hypothetical protein